MNDEAKRLAVAAYTDAVNKADPSSGQRRRIWQIECGMLCSVLGTCLSLADLYTIARRARCDLDPSASAYQVHSWFVGCVAYPNDHDR